DIEWPDCGRQRLVGRAVAVPLQDALRVRDAIGSGKVAEQVVEAAVLQIEDDDVADFFELRRRSRFTLCGEGAREEHKGAQQWCANPRHGPYLIHRQRIARQAGCVQPYSAPPGTPAAYPGGGESKMMRSVSIGALAAAILVVASQHPVPAQTGASTGSP